MSFPWSRAARLKADVYSGVLKQRLCCGIPPMDTAFGVRLLLSMCVEPQCVNAREGEVKGGQRRIESHQPRYSTSSATVVVCPRSTYRAHGDFVFPLVFLKLFCLGREGLPHVLHNLSQLSERSGGWGLERRVGSGKAAVHRQKRWRKHAPFPCSSGRQAAPP